MPRYSVDVTAIISVTIDARSEDLARKAADLFVDNLSPTTAYVGGYRSTQIAENQDAVVASAGGFDVEGYSDVYEDDDEPVCPHCEETYSMNWLATVQPCPNCNGLIERPA